MSRLRRIAGAVFGWLPRPLDPVRSIKAKLSLALGFAGGVGLLVLWYSLEWIPLRASFLAVAVALALVTLQVMAHGAIVPLRQMTVAAREMAHGDYTRRVRTHSRDEVGELAAAFNQMASDLAAADRQRRELIANVSHELRTPITALRGLLENVVDGVAQPSPAEMRTALAQTERLGRLVAELLDLSRLDAGVVPMQRETIAVAGFLRQVVAEARVNAAGGGRDVRFELDVRDERLTVPGDPERLHQVFANLLDNAARHSPPGGTVRVRVERQDDDLLFAVADSGDGIPATERDRVFERFTRGERATGGGTGLGLAIARWVVQLHHGTIAVVDPADDDGAPGCHVHVRLPGATTPALTGST
ncbi:sensor histidine kinase [Spirilliplanes yamanashiensis]|uniref:histidine kinase n=1 Tax=Spirilliplanes yamanashiensis TaxID=42233 RepID=A0A8J3Y6X6_9ACTN|nr:HAMP domain-containing sensor histidine kinase [Spirilliplanes yamanashiensis]MDP9814845.1 signal transduction histidine kinase [Spirilliplanes yamanashiensis]GIJ02499.1 two-component sensor histidine kinase [Spirilliplanes yamanashiensis]